jgi:hypothetical protein
LAVRTRALDCFWAGLPIVRTEGNELADQIAHNDLGATVPQGDPRALSDVLEQVPDAGRAAYASRARLAALEYAWHRIVEALVRYLDTEAPIRPRGLGRRLAQMARDAAFRSALAAVNAARLKKVPFS